MLKVQQIFQCKAEDEATPSQPTTKGEEEEKEKEEEKVVEIFDFEDDFEVFNQPQSLEASTGDFSHLPSVEVSQIQGDSSVPKAMGIQCKPKIGLLEVMESQSRRKAPEKTTQAKLPPLLPTQPL